VGEISLITITKVLSKDVLVEEALRNYQKKRCSYTATIIVHEARLLMHALHPPNSFVSFVVKTAFDVLKFAGPMVARKFIKVYEQGLFETEWNPDESNANKLKL